MAQVNGTTEQQPQAEQSSLDTAPPTQQKEPHPEPASLTDPLVAATSLDDSGQDKRPRDARLLHIILSSLGVQAYQDRVPLQLMDFAYRYTSGILGDAVHLASDAYGTGPGNKNNDINSISLQSVRLAIASRQHYQFQPTLPKEHFAEMASERNKIALPPPGQSTSIRLPPERYRLTGVGYSLRDEWDHDVEVDDLIGPIASTAALPEARTNGAAQGDSQMSGVDTAANEGEADEEMADA